VCTDEMGGVWVGRIGGKMGERRLVAWANECRKQKQREGKENPTFVASQPPFKKTRNGKWKEKTAKKNPNRIVRSAKPNQPTKEDKHNRAAEKGNRGRITALRHLAPANVD